MHSYVEVQNVHASITEDIPNHSARGFEEGTLSRGVPSKSLSLKVQPMLTKTLVSEHTLATLTRRRGRRPKTTATETRVAESQTDSMRRAKRLAQKKQR
jgi:hypothetical protein